MLIGHDKIVQFFDTAIKNSTLGHTYCLVGAHQVGKRKLAQYVATQILQVAEDKLATNPDYLYLERETDEKTGKLKKEISVKQARAVRERLQNSSWLGKGQIVIIDEAELLNNEASNALLKILEEPPKNSVIFLLTIDDAFLLPTIRSRCQSIYVALVDEQKIAQGLMVAGVSREDAADIASIAWGRPGRAVEMWQDPTKRSEYYAEIERLKKIVTAPFYAKLEALEELFGKKDDDAMQKRDRWKAVLDIWQMQWRDWMLKKQLGESTGNSFSLNQIVEIIDNLKKTQQLMGENVNPRLLIEETIIKF